MSVTSLGTPSALVTNAPGNIQNECYIYLLVMLLSIDCVYF